MENVHVFPFEVRDLDPEKTAEITKYFKGVHKKFVVVGPEKYFYGAGYRSEGPKIYNMEVRSTDIYVLSFPKSGTTWTQELVWLLGNNFDYDTAKTLPLMQRFPFLELSMTVNSEFAKSQKSIDTKNEQIRKWLTTSTVEVLKKTCSDRFIKSHLPLSLLPPRLLETAKVVYVARNPRDVAVSYYHYARLMLKIGFEGDFKKFWDFFRNSLVNWAPYFPHVKEAWAMRNHPNLLFLYYEELYTDLPSCVRRVASFMNKSVTKEQMFKLCHHLSFENFKNNDSVNYKQLRDFGVLREGHSFIRQGKAGSWHEYFGEEMTAQAQQWIDDNLRDTDGLLFK